MTQSPPTGRQRRRLTASVTDMDVVRQRAFLIGMVDKRGNMAEAEGSLDELALLTETSGSEPVDMALVRRDRPDAALFIGKGKARELAELTGALDIDVVVFDNELSPAQQRNLNELFEVDVVDRVALILDIFAQHATTKEGMLQVELAQHRYRLPRLRGQGTSLSRLGAGVLARGPGETKLETDRRRVLERVSKIERELEDLSQSRDTRTKARKRSDLSLASLVGYTNAGKSTLFNRLTDADVLVADQLFATLDSTVRRTDMPNGKPLLMSDTVGFVKRLPHELVESFRSTLEEVNQADILLHIVDGADPDPGGQIAAVRSVLSEIGAGMIDEILVINKADIASPAAVERLLALHPGSVAVSAVTGEGVDQLFEVIIAALEGATVELDLLVPYDRGAVVSSVHDAAEILEERHVADGTALRVRLPKDSADRFSDFVVVQPA